MKLTFHKKERHDLIVSWLLVSLAFAIMMIGGAGGIFRAFTSTASLLNLAYSLGVALVTVGIGFVLHEVAHKWVAHNHKLHSEYKADRNGLIITILSSLFTIVIAAPGAVHLHGHQNQEMQGRIALAGPVANLLLALAFLLLSFVTPVAWLAAVFGMGAVINSFLGLFNLIPFPPFDGLKVFNWSKPIYITIIVIAAILSFVSYLPNTSLF